MSKYPCFSYKYEMFNSPRLVIWMDGWILPHLRLFTYKRSSKSPNFGMKSTNLREKRHFLKYFRNNQYGANINIGFLQWRINFIPFRHVFLWGSEKIPATALYSEPHRVEKLHKMSTHLSERVSLLFVPTTTKKNGWTGKRIETWQPRKGRPCRIWDKNLPYHITTKKPLAILMYRCVYQKPKGKQDKTGKGIYHTSYISLARRGRGTN